MQDLVEIIQPPPFSLRDITFNSEDSMIFLLFCFLYYIASVLILYVSPMTKSQNQEWIEAPDDTKRQMTGKHIKSKIFLVNCLLYSTGGIYYCVAYGIRVNTWCNNFEKFYNMIVLINMLQETMLGLYYGYITSDMILHHLIVGCFSSLAVLYNRYGSETLIIIFLHEINGCFWCLREILPHISDNTLANTFRFVFRGRNVDNQELKRRSDAIRYTNEFIFLITYIIPRILCFEYGFPRFQFNLLPIPIK